MADQLLSQEDIRQIRERGMEVEEVLSQIEVFRRGFPKARLNRACTPGDGITILAEDGLRANSEIYREAAEKGRAMKFVPASGAASRMFKLPLAFMDRCDRIEEKTLAAQADQGDPDSRDLLRLFRNIRHLAFYPELKSHMERDGLDTEALLSEGRYEQILGYLLTPVGLNLADLPKGLIPFHRYPEGVRTPFEEHLVEAKAYVRDKSGAAGLHFTVSPEHEDAIRSLLKRVRKAYEGESTRFEIGFSVQAPSTDTVAVDMENRPFRGGDGRLVFRPGGHGALLPNLNSLRGDIVFIKNIDNVVPDRLKGETNFYKTALGGHLARLQGRIFDYLGRLEAGDATEELMDEVFVFLGQELSVVPPRGMGARPAEDRRDYLVDRLNRPLRVCGMVRNQGEPGGGPFWVEERDGGISLQIVESSQVDMDSPEQRRIWESATHFNPVDLVCGLRDKSGVPFDLTRFRDPDTGFISIKSREGRELKALELPGLWNGAMAGWNSVFVEVPITTFNPVKTVLDLLREEHQ